MIKEVQRCCSGWGGSLESEGGDVASQHLRMAIKSLLLMLLAAPVVVVGLCTSRSTKQQVREDVVVAVAAAYLLAAVRWCTGFGGGDTNSFRLQTPRGYPSQPREINVLFLLGTYMSTAVENGADRMKRNNAHRTRASYVRVLRALCWCVYPVRKCS